MIEGTISFGVENDEFGRLTSGESDGQNDGIFCLVDFSKATHNDVDNAMLCIRF